MYDTYSITVINELQVESHGQKYPIQRAAQPKEVAPSFVFLADNAQSSYVSGEVRFHLQGYSIGYPKPNRSAS
jgi:NAD(P)-dependent dehydrogenase (short-subunit alcohol dehydrogenase family)